MDNVETIAGKKIIKELDENTVVLKNKDKIEIYFPKFEKTIKFPAGSEFIDAFSHRGNWVITSEYKNGSFGLDLVSKFKQINILKNLAQKPMIEVSDMMSLYTSAAYCYCDDLGYQTRSVYFQEGNKMKKMSVSKLIRSRVRE